MSKRLVPQKNKNKQTDTFAPTISNEKIRMALLNKQYALQSGKINTSQFNLPERVIQFGTGVLLRGLVDFVIDKANKQNVFNGRVTIIKTTNSDASDFEKQDCVFTLNERGIENGENIDYSTVITSISRLINANDDWDSVLRCAENLNCDVIVSNTTEAGLKYVESDSIFDTPPQSFPAKLTALLYHRFNHVQGKGNGFVIVPTELLVGNGDMLKDFVERHAQKNHLPPDFLMWLNSECRFCNSLVDRIVTGAPNEREKAIMELRLDYIDNLMINSESFLLWAIEGDTLVKQKLSFAQTESRVVITENIEHFREQKLRILNGGHTISVPLAFLKGLRTVGEMIDYTETRMFVEGVIKEEIVKTLDFDTTQFALSVMDRFQNPFNEHALLSITLQCSAKMNARNAVTFIRYFEKFKTLPPKMVRGFAAYLLFTRPLKEENGKFFGKNTFGDFYPIQDEFAPFFKTAWQNVNLNDVSSIQNFVEMVLGNASIFNAELKSLPQFSENVSKALFELNKEIYK